MAVRLYINCTKQNWHYQFSTHSFNPFSWHSHPVQMMHGRTANFKMLLHMYCEIAGSYDCTPVHQMYKSGLKSPMFCAPVQSIWWPFASCTVDVQTYSQFKKNRISYAWAHLLCMGELGAMAARPYIDCTNMNCRHQCSTHRFNPFGCHWHPLQ